MLFPKTIPAYAAVCVLQLISSGAERISAERISIAILLAGIATGSLFLLRLVAAKQVESHAEKRFRMQAEAIPQIVWTAIPGGEVDYCNRHWYELTGLTREQTLGFLWSNAVHPEQQSFVLEAWRQSCDTGTAVDLEYRLRIASGAYRWHQSRATPLRDESGKIIKWFGACTDIEDQKHHQQILEEQVQLRTEEVAEANVRLQQQMAERDLARKKLDQQNEKMVNELTERSRRATLLAKMAELLQSCADKDEVFAAALGYAPKVFPMRRGALALLNGTRDLVEVAGQWHDCFLSTTAFEPNACWALRTGHPHLVVAGDSTAPCAHASGVKNTYLCLPILTQGQAIGILHFQTTDESPSVGDAELSFKTTFAGQVGLSIANIRLREALRSQSIKDSLTGLYNRRYMAEMMDREIRRAVRSEQSLGVLMLDLDHFKNFNDTYGHDAGDTVLRETAAFLSKSIRLEDILCRYGGEEFVILLPTANRDATLARAERIRSKLRGLIVLHQGQSLGMITISAGVAALPEHGVTAQQLLEAADAALYRAKREGRDRVVAADVIPVADIHSGGIATSV